MTWQFDPSGESFDLYAPDGSTANTDVSFDGAWGTPAPDAVYTEATSYIGTEFGDDNISAGTALSWLGELIADDIEEGTPE